MAATPYSAGEAFERLPLTFLPVGTEVSGAAVVRRKEEARTKKGDPFLTIELGNRTGSTTCRIWQEQVLDWASVTVGSGVEVRAQVKAGYNGGPPELSITRMIRLESGHPVELEMHPRSAMPLAKLMERYERLCSCLTPWMLALVRAVIDSTGGAYFEAPAATGHHHAYLHGLLEHSCEVAELALALMKASPAYLMVNWDCLIGAALLHDIGKVAEYQWTGGPIRVDAHAMAMSYHTVSGQLIVERVWQRQHEELLLAGVAERHVAHVQHVIASHHAIKEHGSVVGPCTLEALLIHLADLASARIRERVDDLCSVPADPDGWVHPPGWRKAPVLTLLPSIPDITPEDGAAFELNQGPPSIPPADVGILRVLHQLMDVHAEWSTMPVLYEDERGCRDDSDDPDFGPTFPRPETEIRGDLAAYLAYLIECDTAQWDERRRISIDDARAIALGLRAVLSPERRAMLDAFVAAQQRATGLPAA